MTTESPTPLDTVAAIAAANDWDVERSEEEVHFWIQGDKGQYKVAFTWLGDIKALHLACGFALEVPEARKSEVDRLVAYINERTWVGHFDVWPHDTLILFRYGHLIPDERVNEDLCLHLVMLGVANCDQHFHTFQLVSASGMSVEEATSTVNFSTQGGMQ